jgi:hypothetical protein
MGTNSLVVSGNLSLSGSATITSVGGSVTVLGDATVAGTASVSFGGSMWTVSGTWTDTSTSANTAGTSTIIFNAVGTQTIQGGVFGNVVLSGGEKDFTAAFTTGNLTLVGSALTMKIGTGSASATWTIPSTSVIQGQTGAILTIAAASSSFPWTLSVQGGNLRGAYHVAISNSTATPGATAYGADSTADAYSLAHGWNLSGSQGPLGPLLTLLQTDPPLVGGLAGAALLGLGLFVRRRHRRRVPENECPTCQLIRIERQLGIHGEVPEHKAHEASK